MGQIGGVGAGFATACSNALIGVQQSWERGKASLYNRINQIFGTHWEIKLTGTNDKQYQKLLTALRAASIGVGKDLSEDVRIKAIFKKTAIGSDFRATDIETDTEAVKHFIFCQDAVIAKMKEEMIGSHAETQMVREQSKAAQADALAAITTEDVEGTLIKIVQESDSLNFVELKKQVPQEVLDKIKNFDKLLQTIINDELSDRNIAKKQQEIEADIIFAARSLKNKSLDKLVAELEERYPHEENFELRIEAAAEELQTK